MEAGTGEHRVPLCAEYAGDVRGRVGRRAALDVVQHDGGGGGGALTRHGAWIS